MSDTDKQHLDVTGRVPATDLALHLAGEARKTAQMSAASEWPGPAPGPRVTPCLHSCLCPPRRNCVLPCYSSRGEVCLFQSLGNYEPRTTESALSRNLYKVEACFGFTWLHIMNAFKTIIPSNTFSDELHSCSRKLVLSMQIEFKWSRVSRWKVTSLLACWSRGRGGYATLL